MDTEILSKVNAFYNKKLYKLNRDRDNEITKLFSKVEPNVETEFVTNQLNTKVIYQTVLIQR